MVRFFFLLFCLGTSFRGISQDIAPKAKQEISEENLASYKTDSDFDYETTDGVSWFSLFTEWLKTQFIRLLESIFGNRLSETFIDVFFTILPYLSLIILLYILYKLVIKGHLKPFEPVQKRQSHASLHDDEHLIQNADLNTLIQQAIQEQNFRLALRYSYLNTIKTLSEKGLIDRQPHKTNSDYIKELKSASLADGFSSITRWYNFVWYGQFDISETQFSELGTTFRQLENSNLNT
ncbi:MAG: DUF4129 domain-containing protein [Flavobacteriaceae bacterium]|nr:DUF4129 domain-containing protein [Flavobacteriaceae bacterium]